MSKKTNLTHAALAATTVKKIKISFYLQDSSRLNYIFMVPILSRR